MLGGDGAFDWYYAVDVVVRILLFAHLVYSVFVWWTKDPDEDGGSSAVADDIQGVLTALDGLFAELQFEMDQVNCQRCEVSKYFKY